MRCCMRSFTSDFSCLCMNFFIHNALQSSRQDLVTRFVYNGPMVRFSSQYDFFLAFSSLAFLFTSCQMDQFLHSQTLQAMVHQKEVCFPTRMSCIQCLNLCSMGCVHSSYGLTIHGSFLGYTIQEVDNLWALLLFVYFVVGSVSVLPLWWKINLA